MTLATDHAVVVLNPHYTGLGIARDLAPLGIRVLGVSHAEMPGNHSRWLTYHRLPDSAEDPAGLRDALLALAEGETRPLVLFPTRDQDVAFICAERDALEGAFIIPFSGNDVIERIMNKDVLLARASELGIGIPRSVTLTAIEDIEAARELTFPVVCKPPYAAQWRRPDIWELVGREKAVRFGDLAELRAFYERLAAKDPVVSVQEWIPGGERDLLIFGSYRSPRGEVLASFTARKRLQYPPLVGTGIVVEALPIAGIAELSTRLLDAFDFTGISEIEFKRDERDGSLHLIEINPRHWDQHRLGSRLGVNLSEAAYRSATGQVARSMAQGRRRALWLAEQGFAYHARKVLLGRAPVAHLFEPLGARLTCAVWQWRDPAPFLSLLGLRRVRSSSDAQSAGMRAS